jgi:hypothetical protein
MRHAVWLLGLVLMASSACAASGARPQAPQPAILPLRTLRLYETGVAYFERSGSIPGNVETSLPVPAGHIDDALKTLVVLGAPGKSSVQGLEFGSSVSNGMARALAGLPIASEGPISYRDILLSLKGAAVEVQTRSEKVEGRIIDVLEPEDPPPRAASKEPAPEPAPKELTVLVLTSRSEIRRFRTSEVVAVRPTDPAFASRLGAALDALSTHGARARRQLRVHAASAAPVTLGYVAETPIWRTSYRLILEPSGTKAVIQGWALLHNDTDEDWTQVKVQLVNGRPDSFLFPLAAPRYSRRELVHPEDKLSTVPQLIDKTVDGMWGDQIGESYGAAGFGLSGIGEGGGGRGEGIGLGSIGTIGHGSGTGTSSELSVGNLAEIAQAKGVESGALFTYTLASPLDLRAHGSTLVPILQQPIEIRTIALFASPSATARSAVRFVNNTGQTLPAGPISFFSDGGFAGEAGLDRLKPGERRFMQYGTDLDVELTQKDSNSREEVRKVTFKRGNLTEHFMRFSEFKYEVENRSGQERVVYLNLDLVNNAKATGADEMDYDAQSGRPFAVYRAAGRSKTNRELKAEEGLSRSLALASLTTEQLTKLSTTPTLPEADRKTLVDAVARQKEVDDVRSAEAKIHAESASIEKDLQRLREHLKAVGGDKGQGQAQAANPFVQRMLTAEDKLTANRKRLEGSVADIKLKLSALQTVLEKLRD